MSLLFSCCILRRERKSKHRDSSRNFTSLGKEVETQTLDEAQVKGQTSQKWIPGILKNPCDRYPTRRHVSTQTPRQKHRQRREVLEQSVSVSPAPDAGTGDWKRHNTSTSTTTTTESTPKIEWNQSNDFRQFRHIRKYNKMSGIALPRNIKVLMTEDGPSRPLHRRDRVVWIDPHGNPEYGVVKWLGCLDGEHCAGLKLDSGRKVSLGDETGSRLYPSRSGARAIVPIKRIMLEMDYAEYSGIRFECKPTSIAVPVLQSSCIPKKRRSLEPGIELITPIRKVGLEGDYDMEMGTEGTGLSPMSWNVGAQVYIRESREMVEILERRLKGKHLLAKVIYLDQSDTPGRVVEMYLSRLMSIGYLVEKELNNTPALLPIRPMKEVSPAPAAGAGGDFRKAVPEKSGCEVQVQVPSAPSSAILRNKVTGGDDNYYQYHARPPSRHILDMAQRLGEELARCKNRSFGIATCPQYGARFSPGEPPVPGNKSEQEVEDPALKPPPYQECVPEKPVSVDEPDRAAVVGVRRVVSNLEARGVVLSGRCSLPKSLSIPTFKSPPLDQTDQD